MAQYNDDMISSLTNTYNEDKNKLGDIEWFRTVNFALVHLFSMYFLYAVVTSQVCLSTFLIQICVAQAAGLGTTAGAHRLWSHKAYKARAPLRILLGILFTMACSGSIFYWARQHRVHHKYTDTNADPHNSKRGFFFCHMQWLLVSKHPDVVAKEKTMSMEDVRRDWVAVFQKRYYFPLALAFGVVLPAWIPWYFLGETLLVSWCSAMFKLAVCYHMTFSVNSFAHMFGSKPYNRNITAAENSFVSLAAVGEGWHNYHHTFPWDYKAAELGNTGYNLTTTLINLWAKMGLAYDLKFPSEELVQKRLSKLQNDLTRNQVEVWGWDDTDMKEQEKNQARIIT